MNHLDVYIRYKPTATGLNPETDHNYITLYLILNNT